MKGEQSRGGSERQWEELDRRLNGETGCEKFNMNVNAARNLGCND